MCIASLPRSLRHHVIHKLRAAQPSLLSPLLPLLLPTQVSVSSYSFSSFSFSILLFPFLIKEHASLIFINQSGYLLFTPSLSSSSSSSSAHSFPSSFFSRPPPPPPFPPFPLVTSRSLLSLSLSFPSLIYVSALSDPIFSLMSR